VILTHAFSGSAYPAAPCEGGWPGYQHEPEAEQVGGAFRVVEDCGAHVVIGNGEEPEKFWQVERDEWESGSEEFAPMPPFVEAISNPIIRAGLRRQVTDMRAVARRCGEGKAPTPEEDE
jgi:hypothetical protein